MSSLEVAAKPLLANSPLAASTSFRVVSSERCRWVLRTGLRRIGIRSPLDIHTVSMQKHTDSMFIVGDSEESLEPTITANQREPHMRSALASKHDLPMQEWRSPELGRMHEVELPD